MSVAESMNWDVPHEAAKSQSLRNHHTRSNKPVVADRWMSEAHRAYTYYVPVAEAYNPDTFHSIPNAQLLVVPASVAISHGLDPAATLALEGQAKQALRVTEGCQTDPLVTGMKSSTKKLRETALAAAKAKREAKRKEMEKASSSRFMANSSFTRIYKKAAFHNYGVGNQHPLQDDNYMASFSINPLMHPTSDKGLSLLKAPRKQVADTAIIHAHYDLKKFTDSNDAPAPGERVARPRSPSPGTKRLLIQEAEDKLRSEVSLAAKDSLHKGARAPLGFGHIKPPVAPPPAYFGRKSMSMYTTTVSDPSSPDRTSAPQSANSSRNPSVSFAVDPAHDNESQANTSQVSSAAPPVQRTAADQAAVDARQQRTKSIARAYDSSFVREQLTWKGSEDEPALPHHATVGRASASTPPVPDRIDDSPNMVPIMLRPFAVPTFPEHNPRAFKHLPPSWTTIIRPAGVQTGGTFAYPYAATMQQRGCTDVEPTFEPVPKRDNVSRIMHQFD